LITTLDAQPARVDSVLSEFGDEYKDLTLEQLCQKDSEIGLQVIGRFTANLNLAGHSHIEGREELLAEDAPRAVFCYGTLRADMTPDGDRWGVMHSVEERHGCTCTWSKGTVSGYALYQQENLDYPFAMASSGGTLRGTLISYPGQDEAWVDAMQRCNRIEGWRPNAADCLYQREIVTVKSDDGEEVKAYLYTQPNPPEVVARSRSFPNGDWLE